MRARLRFLREWRFWLNYAFILAVTCWIPILTQKAVMTKDDGTILQQSTISVRAYQSWISLFKAGPGAGHGMAVALHLGICLLITAAVWFVMFRPVIQDLPDPVPEQAPQDGDGSAGDKPHE